MQLEIKNITEIGLRLAETIIAAAVAAWGIVRRTVNAMGEAIRTEFTTADAILQLSIDSATLNCTRHEIQIQANTTRLNIIEMNQRGIDDSYGAMRERLDLLEKELDKQRDKREEDRLRLENRITKLENKT